MALIHCKECNKEISSEAGVCPHCGFRLEENSVIKTFIVIFIIIIATLLGYGEAKRQYQEYKIKKEFEYAGSCSANRRTVDGSLKLYLENTQNASIPTLEKMVKEGYLRAIPICPSGGSYLIEKSFAGKLKTVCTDHPSIF